MRRLTRLVALVFETCYDLYGETLLDSIGCWLCCDWYVWLHWFLLWGALNGCYFSFLKSFLLNGQSIRLVILVFTLGCFEWLLFLLFEVLLVECAVYTIGHVGFHQVYSEILWMTIFICVVIYSISMGTFSHTGR